MRPLTRFSFDLILIYLMLANWLCFFLYTPIQNKIRNWMISHFVGFESLSAREAFSQGSTMISRSEKNLGSYPNFCYNFFDDFLLLCANMFSFHILSFDHSFDFFSMSSSICKWVIIWMTVFQWLSSLLNTQACWFPIIGFQQSV
jgi:hypothetical protein